MLTTRPRVAVIDDYQSVARRLADWRPVEARADVTVFGKAWLDEDEIAQTLAPFDIVVLLRERTAFPERLLARLPNLKLIAMTGRRTSSLDLAACRARNIVVTYTESNPPTATAELTFALMLACVRALPQAHANVIAGRWQDGVPMGRTLEGRRLGVVGLGHIGGRVARYAQAFGMDVVAWSPNLTDEKAADHGVVRVDKHALFATSDVVSVHLGLSERTRGVIGAAEIDAMPPGAVFVNTSRGPLVDEPALLAALRAGHIRAGLDVYDVEPLPPGHPFTTLPNVVLTPHLGFVVRESMTRFYTQAVENIVAYLDGSPTRVVA
ncbi:MAG: D-2-hydroxyacid dehydrogenase family protein [Burkholderiales bacterium]